MSSSLDCSPDSLDEEEDDDDDDDDDVSATNVTVAVVAGSGW